MADDSGGLTVRAFAAVWLEDVRARGASATTYTRYEKEYRCNIDPVLGDAALGDVGRRELKGLIFNHSSRGLDSSMLIRVLSMLFGHALEEGAIPSSPAQRLWKHARSKERTEDVKAFTKAQLALFLDVSLSEPLYSDLFRTMAFSGVRSGEVRALIASDVHEKARKLDVIRTFSGNSLQASTKTKAARRIEIPRELATLLGRRARERRRGGWLFDREGQPLLANSVREAFRRVVKRAGLPLHHGTHSLRHTYASHLLAQGVPIVYVQRQLGHRSIRQTVDVYGRWIPMHQTGELERLVVETEKARATSDEPEDERPPTGRLLRFRGSAPWVRTSCSPVSDDDSSDDSDRGIA